MPHASRLALLRTSFTDQFDALLVSARPNVRYLSGFSGSAGLLVVTRDDAVLITDFRYATQVKHEVSPAVRVIIEATNLWERLWTELKALARVEVVAFESAHVTHLDTARFLKVEEGSAWRWRPALNLVEVLRESKDDGEIAMLREAVAIAEHALAHTLPQVRVGMTELAVAGILEHELRKAGAEGYAFETIVAAGARSALPHARASAAEIRAGDFLLIDYGAVYRGYHSDITRTMVVGRAPDARQSEIYEVVREANGSASALIRAGMRGKDADALARHYIERRGFGEQFGHSLGHGIGLEIHEGPRVARSAEAPLPTGAVVTIEPGLYFEGWGGVRIEDDVVLTANGPAVLTRFDRALLQVG